MSIGLWLATTALISLLQPQNAPIPDRWRGYWFTRGADTAGLERVEVSADRIRIRWRNENVECTPATGALTTTQTLLSVTLRCQTRSGVLQLALTSASEPLLLAHITVPGEPDMRIVVLTRGATAAPRPPSATPPPQPAGLPQFPWPPPRWTARTVLPLGIAVTTEGEALGAIFDRLRTALRRADIAEWSVYAIGADGFAVVSRLEHINDDGRPAPERWSVAPVRPRPFSLADYFAALFRANAGRYRVIAFVVTALPVTASAEAPDRETMERLLRSGAGNLSDDLRGRALPPSGRCEALVYEFFRRSQDDSPAEVTASQIPVNDHLTGAGLWKLEELNR